MTLPNVLVLYKWYISIFTGVIQWLLVQWLLVQWLLIVLFCIPFSDCKFKVKQFVTLSLVPPSENMQCLAVENSYSVDSINAGGCSISIWLKRMAAARMKLSSTLHTRWIFLDTSIRYGSGTSCPCWVTLTEMTTDTCQWMSAGSLSKNLELSCQHNRFRCATFVKKVGKFGTR